MRRRPHSVDGCLVNMIPWQTPSQEVFEELRFASFWVRLEEVPSEFRSLQFGSGLLQPIGQILYTGLYDSRMENKEFIRGFVRIDVTQPLLGRRKARFSHGGEFWVKFGYEGLPTVCFGCGLLGHPLRLCPSPFSDGSDAEDRGPWMQVEKVSYHQVKTAGVKRTAADSVSGGSSSSAAAVDGLQKLPKLSCSSGPGGGHGNAAAGLASFSGPSGQPAPPGFASGLGQRALGQSSSLVQEADKVMVDAVSESIDFLLDQPVMPEVPPLHPTLLSELTSGSVGLYIEWGRPRHDGG
ncbi:hypothetical protein LINPERPRIM_LOCUS15268 [Linum perenne]